MSSKYDTEDGGCSSDGSDSEGSLVDFILKSEDEEEVPSGEETDNEDADAALVNEFPYDPALLQEPETTSGPRRSRRQRKAPVRYVDDKYAQLMYDDVELDKLDESDEDEAAPANPDSEDEDYEQGSECDSDDESDESESEQEDNSHDEPADSTNEDTARVEKPASGRDTQSTDAEEMLLTDPPTATSTKRPSIVLDVGSNKKPKIEN